MPGTSIGTSLNFGFAGTYAFGPDNVTGAKAVASDSDNIYFGQPVVLNSDNTVDAPTSTTLSAANFHGVALAVAQQNNVYPPTNTAGYFSPNTLADIIRRGVVTVECVHGTPSAGGAVYVRIAEDTAFPLETVGQFRADADGGNTVQLTNCCWENGEVDARNMTALRIKSVNN